MAEDHGPASPAPARPASDGSRSCGGGCGRKAVAVAFELRLGRRRRRTPPARPTRSRASPLQLPMTRSPSAERCVSSRHAAKRSGERDVTVPRLRLRRPGLASRSGRLRHAHREVGHLTRVIALASPPLHMRPRGTPTQMKLVLQAVGNGAVLGPRAALRLTALEKRRGAREPDSGPGARARGRRSVSERRTSCARRGRSAGRGQHGHDRGHDAREDRPRRGLDVGGTERGLRLW